MRGTRQRWQIATVALGVMAASVVAASAPAPSAAAQDGDLLDALADRLPVVAAVNDRTVAELRDLLRHDPTVRVDAHDRLYFVDDRLPTARPDDAADGGGGDLLTPLTDGLLGLATDTIDALLDATPVRPDTPPLLHSRPGADRVIHLDFDGHRVEGTRWNGRHGAPAGAWDAEPYDTDGLPWRFSAAERATIEAVWAQVAEDYAPFDVDVTTEDPGIDAITRSGPSDEVYGGRVVITHTSMVYEDCDCGGIAYEDVFDATEGHAAMQPAWVFDRGVRGAANLAYAASHEMGHQLGLAHHGTADADYHEGHGGWAPLMGFGHLQPLTQWAKGEYPDANNTAQLDVETIAGNGAPLRQDDHGDSTATATALSGTARGVIEDADDVDAFSFTASSNGPVTVAVTTAALGPNLDVGLTMLAGDDVIGSANPVSRPTEDGTMDGLDAELIVPAGTTVTLTVEGVGRGKPEIDGYSDYGSLGAYEITVRE